jgi:DNA repair exonuclease SbcCD ATPase subunit
MKFTKLCIDNFMAIGRAELSLADRGLVLIQGENEDDSSAVSNGAGKSSIADALSWCLYGSTAREEDGDGVVNIAAGKGTRVSIHIREGDTEYVVARHRKHSIGKNTLTVSSTTAGSPTINMTKGTTPLTQPVVDAIMGCSLEVFWGAIYAGQEKMPDIPGMTDKQLKVLIEEASGAMLLEAAYKEANALLLAKKNALGAAELHATNAAQREKEAAELIKSSHDARDKFEADRIETVREIAVEAKRTKTGVADAEADLAEMVSRVDLEAQIAALDDKIASVEAEQTVLRDFEAAMHKARGAADQATTNLIVFERQVTDNAKALKGLDHKIGCPCGTCDRPFTAADIEPAKKIALKKLTEASEALTDARAAKDSALLNARSAVSARDAYKASMTDLTGSVAERASLIAALRAVTLAESGIKGLKSDLANAIRAIKAKRDETNPFIAQITAAEKRMVDMALKAKADQNLVIAATTAVRVHTKVSEIFSPSGVRAFLLDEVTPFLNDQTAKYLGTLSDGNISATWTTLIKNAKGELREKFSVEIATTSGGATFKSVSGGEKRKVRIACALALQDLVARRASKPIELFIGDEIDDALDPAGLQRLAEILEEKGKERGTVLVISHNDLKDMCRNTITVKKSGGKATIEECVS